MSGRGHCIAMQNQPLHLKTRGRQALGPGLMATFHMPEFPADLSLSRGHRRLQLRREEGPSLQGFSFCFLMPNALGHWQGMSSGKPSPSHQSAMYHSTPAQVSGHLLAAGLTETECCCVALDFQRSEDTSVLVTKRTASLNSRAPLRLR